MSYQAIYKLSNMTTIAWIYFMKLSINIKGMANKWVIICD